MHTGSSLESSHYISYVLFVDYELYGVVTHTGSSLESGYYISYVLFVDTSCRDW